MIKDEYLSQRQLLVLRSLIQSSDTTDIKIISGVRGSGHSRIFRKLGECLLINGAAKEQIIELNLEHILWDTNNDSLQLQNIILSRLTGSFSHYYVILKQIAFIDDWEIALHELLKRHHISFFLSISSADWLSPAFQDYFGDRYAEYLIYPLSFSEYRDANKVLDHQSLESLFSQYIHYGSLFPVNAVLVDDRTARAVASGMYYTILVNDLMRHNVIKDMPMFGRLTQYMMQNIGILGSPKSISDYFTSIGHKIASETIANYLTALENSYIFYKIPRYDIQAHRELKSRSKHYIVDTGLRHSLTNSYDDIGYELENTILFELLRRGYQVQIGKIGKGEIDFIAKRDANTEYYQVCRTIFAEDSYYSREYEPLLQVKDPAARKVILSMDKTFPAASDGIEYKNILSFLCEV